MGHQPTIVQGTQPNDGPMDTQTCQPDIRGHEAPHIIITQTLVQGTQLEIVQGTQPNGGQMDTHTHTHKHWSKGHNQTMVQGTQPLTVSRDTTRPNPVGVKECSSGMLRNM